MGKRRPSSGGSRRDSAPASLSRRQALKTSLALGTTLLLGGKGARGAGFAPTAPAHPAAPPPLIDPAANNYAYFKAVAYKNALPVPPVNNATVGNGMFTVRISKNSQYLGLVDTKHLKTKLKTDIFGYNGIYPGPTFLTLSDKPVFCQWINDLPKNHILDPQDNTSIMSAYVPGKGVPTVTHCHGAHSDSEFDGTPDQWYKKSGECGMDYPGTNIFYYDNSQEGGTCWYHDHAMGVTRLNAYAGMAGFWLVLDANELAVTDLKAKYQLPTLPYEFGLAFQDKFFTTTGQMWYPNIDPPSTLYPTILPEVFCNFSLVNGMVWPYMEVEPRPYRFRLLNGNDARWLHFYLSDDNVPFFQVGSELGLLDTPVDVNQMFITQPTGDPMATPPVPSIQRAGLLLAPGERADVVIDFSAFKGKTIYLLNDANAPMPMGDAGNYDPVLNGQVMRFQVTRPLDKSVPRAKLPDNLRPVSGPVEVLNPRHAARTRKLILYETLDELGRIKPMLGTVKNGAMAYDQGPITETPRLDDLEIWEMYNTTPDLHPMHVHLVAHQVLGRFPFTADIYLPGNTAGLPEGTLKNVVVDETNNLGLEANEGGWKDTTHMWPGANPNPEGTSPDPVPIAGQMTRIIARFDKPGLYVWHCHILSHEEHDMMRPFYVTDPPHYTVPDWPHM